MPYMCLSGQTLIGTAGLSTQLTTSCQANGAFTAVSSSLWWIGAPLPSETGVFNDVVNPVQEDITNSGIQCGFSHSWMGDEHVFIIGE